MLWRGVQAKLLASAGRIDEGAEMGREAVRLAHTSDDPTAQGNVLVDLAEVLPLADRPEETAAALEAAMQRFESKGNSASAARVMEQLDALGDQPVDRQDRGIGRIG